MVYKAVVVAERKKEVVQIVKGMMELAIMKGGAFSMQEMYCVALMTGENEKVIQRRMLAHSLRMERVPMAP